MGTKRCCALSKTFFGSLFLNCLDLPLSISIFSTDNLKVVYKAFVNFFKEKRKHCIMTVNPAADKHVRLPGRQLHFRRKKFQTHILNEARVLAKENLSILLCYFDTRKTVFPRHVSDTQGKTLFFLGEGTLKPLFAQSPLPP